MVARGALTPPLLPARDAKAAAFRRLLSLFLSRLPLPVRAGVKLQQVEHHADRQQQRFLDAEAV